MTTMHGHASRWEQEAFGQAAVGMSIVGLDDVFLSVNDALCRLLARGAAELVGRCTMDFLHPDDRAAAGLAALPDQGRSDAGGQEVESRYVRPDGSLVHVVRVARVLRDEDGQPAARLVEHIDVTTRRAREMGLADLGRQALDGASPERLREEAVTLIAGVLRQDPAVAADLLDGAMAGALPAWSEHAAFVFSVANVLHSAAARLSAEHRYRHQALHDVLTGLPNRLLLAERMHQSLARMCRHPAEHVALLLLDLDGFKDVNDTLGHAEGDALLRQMSYRLRGAVRPADTVVRLGGDEFAVLLEEITDDTAAVEVAERLLDVLRSPFRAGGRELHLGASGGLVLTNDPEATIERLLGDADLAMYAAKGAGRNRVVVFTPDLRESAASRVSLESDLRRAISTAELTLHFQPVVELATGRWIGAEALARWPHPSRGMVPPNEFVPAAEQTGLVGPLGLWVLDRALARVAAWRPTLPAGADFTVAVNLSVRQLMDADITTRLLEALDRHGLPPEALMLELTESVLFDHGEQQHQQLIDLRNLGVRVAIDDFGTGYSSLSYLARLPIDVVKVDRSFVAGLPGGRREEAVTRAVATLVHDLDLEVVAEGVERPEQASCLQDLGVNHAQGFWLQRPVPAEDFAELLPLHQGSRPLVVPAFTG